MREHSSCGVGFVASTAQEAKRRYLDQALRALTCVEHRGGLLADQRTGDGAGVMTDIPFDLFGIEPGSAAVATLFLTLPASAQRQALDLYGTVLRSRGLVIRDTRTVPLDTSALGRQAREALPTIVHLFIDRPEYCRTEASFGSLLYQAKQVAQTALRREGLGDAVATVSMSAKTLVYKALTRSQDLAALYPDLRESRYATRFALFHRRFSTNTSTSWDKAQPFQMVAHNGEINTIACNRSWAVSREQTMGLPAGELLSRGGISDSQSLDEMVEALRWRSSIPHLSEILAIMMPPAGAAARTGFYRFWSRAMEPWDGPAFLAYSDGDVVGARLDRNGFRPCRWARTSEAFYLASESGLFGLDDEEVLEKGSIPGGSGVHVDLRTGELRFRDPSEARENYKAHFDPRLEPIGNAPVRFDKDVLEDQGLFQVTKEEVDELLVPMAATGKEPIGSMGDTARPAFLSEEPRSFFDFFYQTFAQVTNPPLDHLRERSVTDLSCHLGRRPNVFAPKTLLPPFPGIELSSPVLSPAEMAYLRQAGVRSDHELSFESVEIHATFARVRGPAGLKEALDDLQRKVLAAIRGGCTILILTDRKAKPERPPIPSLLAFQAASQVLTDHGHRLDASIVVDTADVRTTHQLAALVGFGASAVCPYLAFELAKRSEHKMLAGIDPETRADHLRAAFEAGLLKVMSKMGISTVQGYQGSMLFTALGLGPELLGTYFPGLSSPIGGLELEDVAERVLQHTDHAEAHPVDTYQLREHRKGAKGERHSMTASLTKAVHRVVADHSKTLAVWDAYRAYVDETHRFGPVVLRDLLRLKAKDPPVPVEDVQPTGEITRRFGSGAMSFGAISAESQRDLIHAMKRVGGRSSSGEGGENPYYEVDGTTASVKQVASGRFGVTAEYLAVAEEVEIKIAQGAKPGEGGQLMGLKVDAHIAKARHATPGVDLISPPPLHDIYSIEDLRQLIYELKQLKPGMRVSVKLVSGANVGTIAAGVVKAGADVVQISGGDGGTGAATITSMKHAGLPWEVGLSEAHRTLVEQGLRSHTVLRVDGGLRTGEDVVKAALLGGEEFGFGKLLLVAEGCIMARVCHKNTCPRGIATHDPKFKAKYRGSADDVVSLLEYLAEDVRRHLAHLGVHRLDEVIGRADLLEVDPAHAEQVQRTRLDFSTLLQSLPHRDGFVRSVLEEGTHRLNERLVEDLAEHLSSPSDREHRYEVESTDRGVLATASGTLAQRASAARRRGGPVWPETPMRIRFEGSAGQGFAAFMTPGLDVTLVGEANDSVAKSMSGGQLVIRPPEGAKYDASRSTIIGNAALYGATGGLLLVNGRAGDRFAVRNSGAHAVVEGAGLHACEYMTNGVVVLLGPVSFNVGAGMTGGTLFLPDSESDKVNTEYLDGAELTAEDMKLLEQLLRAHVRWARGSGASWLENGRFERRLRKWVPRAQQLRVRPAASSAVSPAAPASSSSGHGGGIG